MAAGNNALWKAVCDTMGRTDLLADERFATPTLRAKHQEDLLLILEEEFSAADSAEWLERFRAAGVPCAPINTYSQILADPQVAHMEWVQPLDLPNGIRTRTFASPMRFCGAGLPVRRRPPALGEHNDELLGPLRTPAAGKPR
jgi:crotonobetainyl-CoA:carnitine CoA-transferase CaiB-like acyl-CoA transferase